MSLLPCHTTPATWAHTHFGQVALGDKRRTRRVQTIAAAVLRQPGASIPRLFAGQSYLAKAAYALFNLPQATPDALQAPHRHLVRQQLHAPGTYLLIEDTTQVSWPRPTDRQRTGLGPTGEGLPGQRQQGVLLHSVVAAAWPTAPQAPAHLQRPAVRVVGLLDQQYHVRQERTTGEKRRPRSVCAGQGRVRESALWERGALAVGSPPPNVRWVVVADRGADIYEHLLACQQQGLGFVVRAAQHRALADPATGQHAGALFAQARALPAAGQVILRLRTRPKQPARCVPLQVSFSPCWALRSPQRPGRSKGNSPAVQCAVVRVWESGPKGVEWVLLCDSAVTSFAQACEVVRQYASRWLIEEFHKALKTGLGAERLQLHTAHRLFAAVAVFSVIALALVALREQARQQPEAPAQTVLPAHALHVLRGLSRRTVETAQEVYRALAALGGHLGRRADGPPGWQTLWRGFMHLQLFVEGVQLGTSFAAERA